MASIYIARDNTRLGSFSEDEVREGLQSGRFFRTDLGWREGMENWQPLSTFAEFNAPRSMPETPPLPGETVVEPSVAPGGELLAADTEGEREGLPWDQRDSIGFVRAFLSTAKLVLFTPDAAFTAMRREGGIGGPFLYFLVGTWFGAVLNLFYFVAAKSLGTEPKAQGNFGFMVSVSFFVPLVFIFISALMYHLSLMLFGGKRPFEATFRVQCFVSGSLSLLQIVPTVALVVLVIVLVVMVIWHLVALTIGFAAVHNIPTWNAFGAVLLPMFVCCCSLFLAGAAAGFFAHQVVQLPQ